MAAVNACYEGDTVIICPGHYVVDGMFCIADSIEIEGRKLVKGKVQALKLAMHKDFLFIWWSLTWVFAFYFGVFLFLLVELSISGWSTVFH